MNLLFSSCSSIISLQFLLNLSSLLPFLLFVVRFLSSIDGLFAAMMKKRSNFRNRNSNSDPAKVSPHACRSPQIREILHRDASMIVINRVSSGFDGYIFGSLSRPPENRSDLLPRCNLAGLVCLQFLKSLSKHIASGYFSVDVAVAIWRSLEFGIDDRWLVMLLEYPVFTFRTYMHLISREYNKNCLILIYDLCKFTRFRFFVELTTLCCGVIHDLCTVSESTFRHQNLLSQGENYKFAVVICCLDLCEVDCYGFLQLESLVYENYETMLMKSGGLQVMAPPELIGFYATQSAAMVQHLSLFVKRDVCSFEVLLIIVVERLLLFHSCVEAQMRRMKRRSPLIEDLKQFHSYVSAHMRLMEQNSPLIDVMEVMLLSCLTKVNSFSSKWLDLHVIIGSQSCVSRQEKIWSRLATLIHEAISNFAGKGLLFTQNLFSWLKCSLFVVTGCSRTEIHSDYGFALRAPSNFLLTHGLLQPLSHWLKSFKRLASGNALEFGSRLLKLQQLMTCGCPQHAGTLTGVLFQLLTSRVQILGNSFGDSLILLTHMLSRVVIVGCDRVQIFVAEVFALNVTHEMVLTQSLPQICIQGLSIDIGIIGPRILEHSSPRPHEVFMSKMRIPSHLEGEY